MAGEEDCLLQASDQEQGPFLRASSSAWIVTVTRGRLKLTKL